MPKSIFNREVSDHRKAPKSVFQKEPPPVTPKAPAPKEPPKEPKAPKVKPQEVVTYPEAKAEYIRRFVSDESIPAEIYEAAVKLMEENGSFRRYHEYLNNKSRG